MAFVKLAEGSYIMSNDVYRLASYIGSLPKCCSEVDGGLNIVSSIILRPEIVAEQFLMVQHGERFVRRLYHLIVSFDDVVDNPDVIFARKVGNAICHLYPDYQSAFAVHDSKNPIHIHLMFNNCPVYPDKPKLTAKFNLMRIRELVDQMVDSHLGIA